MEQHFMNLQKVVVEKHEVQVINFADFVDYAKRNSEEPHYSFSFRGVPVSLEHNGLYILATKYGTLRFNHDEVLFIRSDNSMYTLIEQDYYWRRAAMIYVPVQKQPTCACGVISELHGTCCGWANAVFFTDDNGVVVDPRHPGFGLNFNHWFIKASQ